MGPRRRPDGGEGEKTNPSPFFFLPGLPGDLALGVSLSKLKIRIFNKPGRLKIRHHNIRVCS
jgi:hypothetical protein